MPEVHFLCQERLVTCEKGETIRAVARNNGIVLKPKRSGQLCCHGLGICGGCLVRVDKMNGVSPPSLLERLIVRRPLWRQACKAVILENVSIWSDDDSSPQEGISFRKASIEVKAWEDEVHVEEITSEQVVLLRDQGERFVLLDVREPYEFERARIDYAVLIPLGELSDRLGELDPEAYIIVICHHGMRSQAAAGFLQSSGFKRVSNLQGGIDGWAVNVDKRIPRY